MPQTAPLHQYAPRALLQSYQLTRC